ncbi:MAG: PD40 domain-containing protein, partial [Pirellulales bacterium]|nr:PD40 domain-containing protein [Pirellulales bacterium]
KSSSRFFRINSRKRSSEELLFNGYGAEGKISPDGKTLLFVREGERWWRKGYVGARSAQIWTFGLQSGTFSKVLDTAACDRSPVWNSDSQSFFYCSSHGAKNGARNLWHCELGTGKTSQVTDFEDDLVATPTISADGHSIVFSKLFDLYRWHPNAGGDAAKIRIHITTAGEQADTYRRILTSASDAAFSDDGLEIAFISGGDLWVMETELKEPVRITKTAEFESDPIFAEKGNAILFVGWKDGQPDIWKVERADPSLYWWQSEEFKLTQITDDAEKESDLQLSPNQQDLLFAHGRGDVRVYHLETGKAETLVDSFSAPAFDVSPDGKWIVYARTDNNFNSDIWIAPIDQTSEAINISRHPDDEYGPKWSPDGSKIA